jgi:5-formyltetrahydrofolate cyclo-ligase
MAGRPSPQAPKATWRAWARAERRAWAESAERSRDEAALRATLRAWPTWRAARWALAYAAFGDEIAPWPLGAGPAQALTRTVPGGALQLRAGRPPLERHPFGFAQPTARAPIVPDRAIDVVLVPGLAFDRAGTRLGYGAGLYDRLLPRLRSGIPRIGVTIDALICEALPREAHDVAMTHLLTPSGLQRIG